MILNVKPCFVSDSTFLNVLNLLARQAGDDC